MLMRFLCLPESVKTVSTGENLCYDTKMRMVETAE